MHADGTNEDDTALHAKLQADFFSLGLITQLYLATSPHIVPDQLITA